MSSASPEFRHATAEDAAAINAIYNHYVATSTCTWDKDPETVEHHRGMIESATEGFPFLVIERAGEVAAWGCLRQFKDRDGYRFTPTDILYVHPDHLGKGLGRSMLTELIDRARAAGHHSLVAQISGDQEPSIRLHESMGFVRVGCVKEAGTKNGRWLDLLDFQLML